MTRIYVVTPAYNAASTIDQTIASVVNQAGPFELHYHVQDGGSTDGTLERLMSWSERLSSGQAAHYCQGLKFTFESSPDAGMYDAIYTGFGSVEPAGEDWQTWINADDILAPGACALMAAIDGDQRGQMVSWVSGAAAVVSNGTVIAQVDRPLCADVIREGLCDGLHWDFVQQEGTFFRRRIWDAIDLETEFRAFKLAGDWNLWRNFAKTTELYQVGYPLGYFHERPGQLSQRERAKYER
ncbi:MAG: glycosyltransferase, partial [Parvularculaceae bacterium]|nr:glycosyltransferase [Parvularculaceae bacterium]